MTIFLASGHHRARLPFHWRDTGTLSPYPQSTFEPPVYNEHHEAEKLVEQTKKILDEQRKASIVIPFTYNLLEKIRYVNANLKSRFDLAIDIHLNSSTNLEATGCEIWYFGGDKNSKAKAEKMSRVLSTTLRLQNDGAKPDTSNRLKRLGFVRDTHCWAFLIEMGYISNIKDVKNIRAFGAQAIIDAINEFYKL